MMDRKEAADLLDNLIGMVEDSGGRDYDTALKMGVEALSAQPDVPDTNVGDMVSRRAAIDALRTCQTYLFYTYDPDKKISLESAEFEIEQLPSAQPEIILCKDCGYYDPADNDEESDWCHAWGETTEENAFCSYAERRTDG